MQSVRAPDGTHWQVAVHWEGRRLRDPAGRYRSRLGRDGPIRPERDDERSWRAWLDVPEFVLAPLELVPGPVVVVLVIVFLVLLVAFLWWVVPPLVVLLWGLVELLVLALVAVGGFTWRTLARRPWTVVASSDSGDERTWHVVGWHRAHRSAERIAAALGRGVAADVIRAEEVARG